ncbi:DUF2752 domain-containing protein [Olivibacter sp. CPCC 100613]|uniref:DUF2752 domain-containing protein n=1 Tax=Olivibacter sp. CPCC 100613 TaxID=3079931 RepID=UPI002FF59217
MACSLVLSIFSSQLLTDWLQHHLLPCPFKWLTGVDCPGCGFQRAFLLLLRGEWKASIAQYPPTIPLLLLGIFFLVKKSYFNKGNSSISGFSQKKRHNLHTYSRSFYGANAQENLTTVLSCLVGFLIIVAYVNKMLLS